MRSLQEFAEQEIVLPNGPYAHHQFNVTRQPFARLWFEGLEQRPWKTHVAVGPTQTGKTLICLVIPALWYLFERRESIIIGVYDQKMADDKWNKDLKPVIEASRYASLMPTKGLGSKGGQFSDLTFRHGVSIRFMTGGGSTGGRAAYTSRVLFISETDKMQTEGVEGSPIEQLEGRTLAYGEGTGMQAAIYKECTASTEDGHIWTNYNAGTASRIVMECPHCGVWIFMTRECLKGWQDAETEGQAKRKAYWACPECQTRITDRQRRKANQNAKLLHNGQTINRNGKIIGPIPDTDSFSMRWDACNNLFTTAGELGVGEWKAQRSVRRDNAETVRRQQFWALPKEPDSWEVLPLIPHELTKRQHDLPQRQVPADTEWLTMHLDLHMYRIYWMAVAWLANKQGRIVDYGFEPVKSKQMKIEQSLPTALEALHEDLISVGWATQGDRPRIPDQVFIDARWQGQIAKHFCALHGNRYRAAMGYGRNRDEMTAYRRPRDVTKKIVMIGDNWHVEYDSIAGVDIVHVNADFWKMNVREGLRVDVDQPGAITLYRSPVSRHQTLVKHLTSERPVQDWSPKKGSFVWFELLSDLNHHLDNLANAGACHDFCRSVEVRAPRKPPQGSTPAAAQPYRGGATLPRRIR